MGQRITFTVESRESATAGEALAPGPSNGFAASVKYADWDGMICVALPRDFAFDLTEAALGGDGSEPPLRTGREFSESERRVARFLIEQLLACIVGVGKSLHMRDLRIDRFESRMEALGLPGADKMIVLDLAITLLGRRAVIKLLLPESARPQLQDAFGHHARSSSAPNDAAWAKQINSQIHLAEVGMRAVIRERMTLGEVSQFAPGQILKLSATPETPVLLEADGQGLYWCRLGQSAGRYTVRIDAAAGRSRRSPRMEARQP